MEAHDSDYLADPAQSRARPGPLQWLVLALLITVLLATGLVLALVSLLGGKKPQAIALRRRLPGIRRLAPGR